MNYNYKVYFCYYVRETKTKRFIGNAENMDEAITMVAHDAENEFPVATTIVRDKNEFGHTTITYNRRNKRYYVLEPIN